MGLDMYLEKEIFIGGYFDHRKVTGTVSIAIEDGIGAGKFDIPVNKISSIILHMGYWRKANQIHNWFVEHVQGGEDKCQTSYVNKEQLEELKNICQEILEDHSKAEELLPTCAGFFFGSTEYDEYYYEDLENTIKIVNKCLEDELPGSFYYHSSW